MNGSRFAFAPVAPLWALALLFVVGTSTAILAYAASRGSLGERRARAVSLLRLGTALLLCAFALNPTLSVKKTRTTKQSVAVLLDASRTMGLPSSRATESRREAGSFDAGGLEISGPATSRLDAAKSILTGGSPSLLEALGERYGVDVYALSDPTRPLTGPDVTNLAPDGTEGDLLEALKAVGRTHSAVILLSDGNVGWNEGGGGAPAGDLHGENPSAGDLPRGVLPRVFAVPVGSREGYRDVLIAGIEAPPLAFRGREVRVEVTVRSYGYAGTTHTVLLRDSQGLIAVGKFLAKSDPWEETLSLSFLPIEEGRKDLTISVPPQAGEVFAENNNAAVSVKVVRDKTRILMVSGSPSLSYRFLRAALKNDPSIDLLSFVILRDPSDVLDVPISEQSLIPFPVDTLFSKELSGFDLLIFDNFNYSLFLNPGHLERIRNYVKEGGGFGAIGGPNLFPAAQGGDNPVADLLPVRSAGQVSYVADGKVGVRMSREGEEHPLLARFSADVLGDAREGSRFWREAPFLDGINQTNAKEHAAVLLEAEAGFPWPILTVSEYGKGRVLVLGTDYAWKWGMGLVARGEGNKPYLGLVHWIIRWLVRDPSLDAVQIELPERPVTAGEETAVRIEARGAKPGEGSPPAVSLIVSDPDGRRVGSRLEPAARPGEYIATFRPRMGGIHKIEVVTPFAVAAESVAVAGPLDSLDPAPDTDLLARAASSTGGKILSPEEDLLKLIDEHAEKTAKRFVEERRRPLWANPFVLAAALGLLGAEWYLRRRWGLA